MGNLTIGIPKGSLQESTVEMMGRAGFRVYISGRSYYPSIDDDELSARLVRPQDMPRYVSNGIIDVGLTGKDWVKEDGAEVVEIASLVYAKQQLTKVRWVLAVPEDSTISSVKDLRGKKISTELVNVTKQYLAENGIDADVEFSHGATEVKAPELVDAIVELTETGSSLRANRLKIIDTVMESTTVFITNKSSWNDDWKRQKMENLAMLFEGAVVANNLVGLKMNVANEYLENVLKKLSALRKPTISPLTESAGYDIDTVMEEKLARKLIPELKRAGAEGIIEYPLNKVVI